MSRLTIASVFHHRGAPVVLIEDNRDDALFVRRALDSAHIVNPLVGFQTADEARSQFAKTQAAALPALFIVDVYLSDGETGIESCGGCGSSRPLLVRRLP